MLKRTEKNIQDDRKRINIILLSRENRVDNR